MQLRNNPKFLIDRTTYIVKQRHVKYFTVSQAVSVFTYGCEMCRRYWQLGFERFYRFNIITSVHLAVLILWTGNSMRHVGLEIVICICLQVIDASLVGQKMLLSIMVYRNLWIDCSIYEIYV